MSFKVGDWVRYKASYAQNITPLKVHDCTGTSFISKSGKSISCDAVELWQPKESEWCWFYDNNSFITIGQYGGDNGAKIKKYWIKNASLDLWEKVEPFIGQLPSFIKDKQ